MALEELLLRTVRPTDVFRGTRPGCFGADEGGADGKVSGQQARLGASVGVAKDRPAPPRLRQGARKRDSLRQVKPDQQGHGY